MTKKREPIDLVGRLASRIDLSAPRTIPDREPLPQNAARHAPARPVMAIQGATAAPTLEEARPEPAIPARDAPLREPGLEAPVLTEDTAAEVESPRKVNPTVDIDFIALQKEGYLTPRSQRTLTAEEYRIIKRPLLRHAFNHVNGGRLGRVIMITSARPGEGKTFTAINLAMSIANERDVYVLLVDCDIRRMGLSKKLGIADRRGLMDVLMEPGLNASDVILRTNVPNLTLIPAGRPTEAATEIFASQGMSRLVDDVASRYPDRFIIFDAPPVLASSEPGVLALHVGQTVMVVHANETSKRAIAQSIPLINSCPKVHFLLNQVTLAAGPDRFGYYGTY